MEVTVSKLWLLIYLIISLVKNNIPDCLANNVVDRSCEIDTVVGQKSSSDCPHRTAPCLYRAM